ncbi:MAG TPA: glycosyltransferase, partial [Acidimicrobiia bacterium]|nr:glycosyltransferase [Acidimicrobiia bacterium]
MRRGDVDVASCPWCGAEDTTPVAIRDDGRPVERCTSCGLARLRERPADVDALYETGYFGGADERVGYDDYETGAGPMTFWWLAALTRACHPRGGTLLDVGAATGTFLEAARGFGFEGHASELNAWAAGQIRAKGFPADEGAFDPERYEPRSFDVVTALEVLEHVVDLRAMIAGLRTVLCDDGVLIVFVPGLGRGEADLGHDHDHADSFSSSLEHTLYFDRPSLDRVLSEGFGAEARITILSPDDETSLVAIVRPDRDGEAPEVAIAAAISGPSVTVDRPEDLRAASLTAAKLTRFEQAWRIFEQLPGTDPHRHVVEALLRWAEGAIIKALDALETHTDWTSDRLLGVLMAEARSLVGTTSGGIVADALAAADLRRRLDDLESGERTGPADTDTAHRRALDRLAEAEQERMGAVQRLKHAEADRKRLLDLLDQAVSPPAPWSGGGVVADDLRRRDGTRADAEARFETPLVSVVVPNYDKGWDLAAAVESVLRGTLRSVEVIVWDDGSTDTETIAAVEHVSRLPSVTVFRGENRGLAQARNQGIAVSRGRFLVCLDPDDVLEPTYLEKAATVLLTHPDIAIAYPWLVASGDRDELWRTMDIDTEVIIDENQVPVVAMFRREVVDATGGFWPAMDAGYEDWEHWVHAAELGFRGRAIDEPLFRYSISADPDVSMHARAKEVHEELVGRIHSRHAALRDGRVLPNPLDGSVDPRSVAAIRRRYPARPGNPLVMFTDGSTTRPEAVLDAVAAAGDRLAVVIDTGDHPTDVLANRFSEVLDATPFAYALGGIAPIGTWQEVVSGILADIGPGAEIVDLGSSWFAAARDRLPTDDLAFTVPTAVGDRPIVMITPWFGVGPGTQLIHRVVQAWHDEGRQVVGIETIGGLDGFDDDGGALHRIALPAQHQERRPAPHALLRRLPGASVIDAGSHWFRSEAAALLDVFPDITVIHLAFDPPSQTWQGHHVMI